MQRQKIGQRLVSEMDKGREVSIFSVLLFHYYSKTDAFPNTGLDSAKISDTKIKTTIFKLLKLKLIIHVPFVW